MAEDVTNIPPAGAWTCPHCGYVCRPDWTTCPVCGNIRELSRRSEHTRPSPPPPDDATKPPTSKP